MEGRSLHPESLCLRLLYSAASQSLHKTCCHGEREGRLVVAATEELGRGKEICQSTFVPVRTEVTLQGGLKLPP